jgi:hypothetical protein
MLFAKNILLSLVMLSSGATYHDVAANMSPVIPAQAKQAPAPQPKIDEVKIEASAKAIVADMEKQLAEAKKAGKPGIIFKFQDGDYNIHFSSSFMMLMNKIMDKLHEKEYRVMGNLCSADDSGILNGVAFRVWCKEDKSKNNI